MKWIVFLRALALTALVLLAMGLEWLLAKRGWGHSSPTTPATRR